MESFGDLKVVGEVGDGLQLIELLKTVGVDMVILDISMPNLPGIEATREIKRILPGVKVLILTMHKKKEYLNNAIASGTDGYLLKEDAPKELLTAIEKIRQGMIYVSPLAFRGTGGPVCPKPAQGMAGAPAPLPFPREIEIIKMISGGQIE